MQASLKTIGFYNTNGSSGGSKIDQKSIQNRPREGWEGSWTGLGVVRRGLGGSQKEAKRDKNTKEHRQDDPGPPLAGFFPAMSGSQGAV